MLKLIQYLFGFVLVATISCTANAACSFDSDAGKVGEFLKTYTEKCYTSEGIVKEFSAERMAVVKANNDMQKYAAASSLFDALSNKLPTMENISSQVKKKVSVDAPKLHKASQDIASQKKYAPVGGLSPNAWSMEGRLWENSVVIPLFDHCKLKASEKMTQACYDYFKQNIWSTASVIYMVRNDVIAPLQNTELQKAIKESNLNLKKWDSYLYDTQFQYPWELWFNFKADGGFDGRFLDTSTAVPDSKWIFLHPDVGLTYFSKGVEGNKLNAAVTLQWIGIQRWSWNDGRVSQPWGIALTSIYSDLAGANNVGHGISILYDKYTLTVTKNSDKYLVTLSLNLGNLLNSDNKTAQWIRQKVNY